MSRDCASEQLNSYKKCCQSPGQLTDSVGHPIGDRLNSMTVGERGPMLLQDLQFIDELAHFDRERIPERVVHAKGAGAFGYFEVTHDISKYTCAKIFSEVGKRTPAAVRFSTVGGESGSADSARDPRGFAMKYYTEDGNWDLVGNNTPIFFIRDPVLFPSFIHTQKRNPKTHLKDPDMMWDFITLRPETCHQVSFLFSNRGTPYGHRHMNGYGSHAFKLVNTKGDPIYCKFHFKTDQKIKNFTGPEADAMASKDPDFSIRDLHNAIEEKRFPSWTTFIQIMSFDEAEKWKYNPFDVTKVWPHKDFPLIPVGKLVLDRNPKNYFAEVEQIAFSPANLVPGIQASPDKMLQGRLFSYNDTHRHRLGANYQQIPVNCPYRTSVKNYQRDGPMAVNESLYQQEGPNYYPNSFSGPLDDKKFSECKEKVKAADVGRFNSANEDNYTQAGNFWRDVLTADDRKHLIANMSGHLSAAQPFLQERVVKMYSKCDPGYGGALQKALDALKSSKDEKKPKL